MKKIYFLLIILFLICGCTMSGNTAKKTVEMYLNGYINLSNEVIEDLNKVVESESLNNDQKEIYRDILKKQYKNLKYEILSENYDGDSARVITKIEVYDLYGAQKSASLYLKNNINHFYDSKGSYDNSKYIDYKLNLMKNTNDRISYTIDFNIIRENDTWILKEITSTDLEKIHGIYSYEGLDN